MKIIPLKTNEDIGDDVRKKLESGEYIVEYLCEKCGEKVKSEFLSLVLETEDGILGMTEDICCSTKRCEKCGWSGCTKETKDWLDKSQTELEEANRKWKLNDNSD